MALVNRVCRVGVGGLGGGRGREGGAVAAVGREWEARRTGWGEAGREQFRWCSEGCVGAARGLHEAEAGCVLVAERLQRDVVAVP